MILPVNGTWIFRITLYVLVFCLIASQRLSAQDEQARYPNQVSINAGKFLRGLFPGDDYAFEIGYRYSLKSNWAIRTSMGFQNQTSESGFHEGRLSLGADRIFKNYGKWKFYYGVDGFGYFIFYKSTSRKTLQAGISALLGVIFYISPHFSISTEPQVYILFNHYIDEDSFADDSKDDYWIYGFGNIGQIKISFHF